MTLILAILCRFANMLFGAATTCYSFKCKGLPGIGYSLFSLAALVVWSIIGTLLCLFFSFGENRYGFAIFFVWHLATFFPWILLCRNKYKISEPEFSRIGISGIFTQLFFLIGIALMLTKENLQEVLEYDIGRFCGGLLLLFTVPAFILTALVFSFKKKSWQCPDTTLALAAWVCALFFFGAGLFAIKVTA